MEIGFLNCNLKVTPRGGDGGGGLALQVSLYSVYFFSKKKNTIIWLHAKNKKIFSPLLSFVNRKGVSRLLKHKSRNRYNKTEQR